MNRKDAKDAKKKLSLADLKTDLHMRIAVIRQSAEDSSSYPQYLYRLLADAAKEHQYEIVEWNKTVKAAAISANAIVIIKSEADSKLSLKWFYEVKLPALLKKINADKVLQMDGCLGISVRQPQLLVLPGVEQLFISSKKDSEFIQYRNRKFDSFLAKAALVITASDSTKTFIKEKSIEGSIQIVPVSALNIFQQID